MFVLYFLLSIALHSAELPRLRKNHVAVDGGRQAFPLKNGGLHHAPGWVIKDREYFFRAKRPDTPTNPVKQLEPMKPIVGKTW